jgi:hypothetical protein
LSYANEYAQKERAGHVHDEGTKHGRADAVINETADSVTKDAAQRATQRDHQDPF